jgi:uncharacterized protein (DUF305 family)
MRHFPHAHLVMFFGMAAISFFVMPFVMIASPFDWRPSLNQAYAAVFMGATMVALEGWMHPMPWWAWALTAVVAVVSVWAIRTQAFVNSREYLHDMMPHHSMAVLTSEQFLRKEGTDPAVRRLAEVILATQRDEIDWMRKHLRENYIL